MSSFKALFCIAFGLLVLFSAADATCNICSTDSYATCVDASSFRSCTDGKTPSAKIETCRENTVCTDKQGVCQPNVTGVVLGCDVSNKCNDCSGGAKFGCVSQTQFAFCTADGELGYVASCEQGQYCSVAEFASSGKICGLSCVVEPTCQNTEPELPPEGDWRESCTSTTTAKYYKNIYDQTCSTYVYCEVTNQVMNALKYTCSSGYFDEVSQRCIQNKPSTCY